jgi:DNA-binding response OmpR family regulator
MKSKKKIIVLIEDEQIMVDLLAKKLADAGYMVKVAQDGVSGLDLIKKTKPDLVLLDMLLPLLDGFGVLKKLAAEKLLPQLPVMVISNTGQPIEIERIKKLGVRDYLIKVNFDPKELLNKINHILKL